MNEIQQLIEQPNGAIFRAADLHVHTPESPDMDKKWDNATAEEVVQHALDNGMEIIAVTDHNTAAFCDKVVAAAEGTRLHVFPGVEISTPQGHLIAVFDKSMSADAINGLLMNAGIKHEQLGTNAAVTEGHDMDEVARFVEDKGGVAIAAHVDSSDRGFMKATPTGADRMRIYRCRHIRAFEVADSDRRDVYQAGKMQGYPRRVACIQSSDCRSEAGGQHQLDAIGARHCYLKMDDVSVEGIKQALLDPHMRIRFTCDEQPAPERIIEGMWVTGGFLQGQMFRFSDDVSCLIGGTGVGKSLTVELLRFALDQQTQVEKIRDEVKSLLSQKLGDGGKVYVLLQRLGHRYVVEREFSSRWDGSPAVYGVDEHGALQPVEDIDVPTFFPIKGYSQSEIIEFTRDDPVRLSLIDDLIDLSAERQAITKVKGELRTNHTKIIETQRELESAEEMLKERGTVQADKEKLEETLKDERVAKHRLWYDEQQALDNAETALDSLQTTVSARFPKLTTSLLGDSVQDDDTPNPNILTEVERIEADVQKLLDGTSSELREGLISAQTRLAAERKKWQVDFEEAEQKYQELLQELDTEGVGFQALNEQLVGLKVRLRELTQKRAEVNNEIRPRLGTLHQERDDLLDELQKQRLTIRAKREEKAVELTQALENRVRVEVEREAERDDFRALLKEIKIGSLLRDQHMEQMADEAHPVSFVKHLVAEEYDQLKKKTGGMDKSDFEKLREVVFEKNRLAELYELQIVDVEDRIGVSLQVADGVFKKVGKLAHGQRCTVILSVAMAEGEFPLIADQPEDALHAEFIEKNIVSTLRERRGIRQYIFATRSANILVSGDAEQVIILESDADRGHIESAGSIDRMTTRDLILLKLEGGEEAFAQRSRKYGIEAS